MKPHELVKILNKHFIEGNLELYKKLLNTTTEATNPVWREILPIYIDLSKEEKEVF
ncbi:hypothetical protein [Chryseobacterium vrystaatense]|uniref:hypothetical protein n=1 Tax=Chryseobacterium vrystaatense TaxID=307480 RepID=UPI001587CB81|nr:hypothetical protein [Chryseobacterium vrystaatense]